MKNLILIAGPCAVEDDKSPFLVANEVKRICDKLGGIDYIFKSSWKKANRTKLDSFTGISSLDALNILRAIRDDLGLPVITDIHESHEAELVAQYVTHLQIPAFLCRQTELLLAAGKTGLPVGVKKGQFVSPEMMEHAVEKVIAGGGGSEVFLMERGTTFGYKNLIVDFTSLPKMRKYAPVMLDCTHCLQEPNQSDGITGGNPDMIAHMVNAAIAVGVDGLFIETHPNPASAGSDAATQLQLDQLEGILVRALKIREAMK
jgi:2-dehydro-3-deoxyphosphooctonate aldolase (KDO 8-P synthase)